MIRYLQTVGWSILSPYPVQFHGPVIALIGENGSGKSSAIDAVKALLGAGRFGSGRTPSSYRFAGRSGAVAVRSAYVTGVFDNRHRSQRRLDGFSDTLTITMEVSSSQRRFLVRDGEHLFDADADMSAQIDALLEEFPRARWLRPSEYTRKVLDPLGLGPAVRRLVELPQGELTRVLDRDPKHLVSLLVELTGGRDAADTFAAARTKVTEARESHAEARRRLDRRRAQLAEARLEFEGSRQAGALRLRLSELGAQIQTALNDDEVRRREHAIAVRARELESRRAEPRRRQREETRPVRRGVIDFGMLRRAAVELVVVDGIACVAEESADRAAELLGPGEVLPLASEQLRASELLICGPALQEQTPEPEQPPLLELVEEQPPAEPDPLPQLMSERHRGELQDALRQLDEADVELGDGGDGGEGEDEPSPGELLGAFRALAGDGIPDPPDAEAEQQLRLLASGVRADEEELERRVGLLEESSTRLAEAQHAYEQAVWRALGETAKRFEGLCADADMAGRMLVNSGADGPQVQIMAAESPGEELRDLQGAQASLSGGWRTTVLVLCLLACLDTDVGLGLLPLDEVGAALDETRLQTLGKAFLKLGQRRELQTIMTMPTSTQSEVLAAFSSQQIGFFRPDHTEALAPPPHIVTAPARAA